MLPFLIVYICLLAVLIPRYPKRGGKHFIVSRNATISDFAKVVEAEDELEQLKLRCSVLSELLWWKTLYIRISFFVAMASIVASMFLLVYIWYARRARRMSNHPISGSNAAKFVAASRAARCVSPCR